MDTVRAFFPKSGHFFRFSERKGEVSPLLPSCVPVSVAEYASISLNMPHVRQAFEDASGSNVPGF